MAFLAAPYRLVTAAHVVLDHEGNLKPGSWSIQNPSTFMRHGKIPVTLYRSYPLMDIAILEMNDQLSVEPLPLNFYRPNQHTELFAWGVNKTYEWKCHKGEWISEYHCDKQQYQLTTIKVKGGWSGTPILNENGQVTGITWGTERFGKHKFSLVTPSIYLQTLV